jgi:ABC-type uncharacterized transport system fused permease/ATPase subunit
MVNIRLVNHGQRYINMLREIYNVSNKPKLIMMLTAVITLLVIEIALTTIIPTWRGYFFEALKNKDIAKFNSGMFYFAALMLSMGAVTGIKHFTSQMLALQIRIPTSKLILDAWMNHKDRIKVNFSQAQTDSIRQAAENYIYTIRECFISLFIVLGLIYLNRHDHTVLLCAGVYTIAVTLLATLFNKPMTIYNKVWQQKEGVYRESLGNLAIGKQDKTYIDKFKDVCKSYYHYTTINMVYSLFGSVKGSLMTLIPYVILSKGYFTGQYSFGEFMATVSTFELIVVNSTIFTIIFPEFTKARASYAIVKEFYTNHK